MDVLYVSDLDGTLFGSNGELSSFSRQKLEELLRSGLPLTVASARSVVHIQSKLQGLSLPFPVIEFNGAFLSDLETGRHEIVRHLETFQVEGLAGLINGQGFQPFLSTFDGKEDRFYYDRILNEGMAWYLEDRKKARDPRLRAVGSLREKFHEKVVCITVIGKEPPLLELEKEILGSFGDQVETHCFDNMYCPGWYWLTVHDELATKDRAIETLRENYGLKDRELVVFGDQTNDVKMFEVAHRGIAVANAVESLKKKASQVIGSNDEDSVVRFLERDWKRLKGLS